MMQRDEDAADAASGRQHVHSKDAEPATATAHHVDKTRHWMTLRQSIEQHGEQSVQNIRPRTPGRVRFSKVI